MESIVLVLSVVALFAIGYFAVDILIPDPRKLRQRRKRRRSKKTDRFK